jgi:lipid-A-disaccharide synthase-like uncharacterized protein
MTAVLDLGAEGRIRAKTAAPTDLLASNGLGAALTWHLQGCPALVSFVLRFF